MFQPHEQEAAHGAAKEGFNAGETIIIENTQIAVFDASDFRL